MAKMKYWNGSAWVILDAKDADTLDGKHASEFAASSHGTHVSYGTGTTGSTYGGEAAAGTASTVSRSDHKHALPTLPTASTSASGIVKLNNTVTSTSTTEALTAAQGKALKDAKADKTYVDTQDTNLSNQLSILSNDSMANRNTILTSTTNLDNISKVGIYRVNNAVNSPTIYGTLEVLKDGAYVTQRFSSSDTSVYYRFNNSVTWLSWKQLATTDKSMIVKPIPSGITTIKSLTQEGIYQIIDGHKLFTDFPKEALDNQCVYGILIVKKANNYITKTLTLVNAYVTREMVFEFFTDSANGGNSYRQLATTDKIDISFPFSSTAIKKNSQGNIRKVNNLITLQIGVGKSDGTDLGSLMVGTLPVGYRPSVSIVGSCTMSSHEYNTKQVGYLFVDATTGNVSIDNHAGTSGMKVATINISYFVD